jgi:CBS domain-containing protein
MTMAQETTASVRDVMHPGIVSCSRAATPSEVARVMVSCRVHSVAVLGLSHDGRDDPLIWGIVSDLDLLRALTERPAPATAGELARQPVITIRSTAPIQEAARAMVAQGTQHLVVVDPDRQMPLGIISTLDVADVLANLAQAEPEPVVASGAQAGDP